MDYIPLERAAVTQLEAARATYREHQQAQEEVERLRDEMVWREIGGDTCLHKLSPDGRLIADLGVRNAHLIKVHDRHAEHQAGARAKLASLQNSLTTTVGANLDAGIGRVPLIAVRILDALWKHKVMDYYRVIGTHALYAYESAAGVSFDADVTATRDVDLLWDVQMRIKFLELTGKKDKAMVTVLQDADATFERDENNKESAINAEGFSVDFLRREEKNGLDAEPFSISNIEGDVYPVPAHRSQEFLNSPVFEDIIVGLDGSMTLMRTIDPRVFVEFKRWMSVSDKRDELKRGRDFRQAEAVDQLLREGRLHSRIG